MLTCLTSLFFVTLLIKVHFGDQSLLATVSVQTRNQRLTEGWMMPVMLQCSAFVAKKIICIIVSSYIKSGADL